MTANSAGNKTLTISATNAGNGVSNIDIDADGAVSIDSSAGSLTAGAVLADGQTLIW